MICDFSIKDTNEYIMRSSYMGNKAKELIMLKSKGFNVPEGFVLDCDTFDEIVSFNDIEEDIIASFDELREECKEIKGEDASHLIKEISERLCGLFDRIAFPEEIVCKVNSFVKEDKKYAVRSSGAKEDLAEYSFAGMYDTYLNVEGKKNIKAAIIKCYKSLFSVNVLTYILDNKIDYNDLKMAVIVQEMVNSEYSGVVFTVNPVTGNDLEMVADVVRGLGNQYVDGTTKPETYYYNWYEKTLRSNEINFMLKKDALKKLFQAALNIQILYGKPCDIEYAIVEDKVYILQVRSITKINYANLDRVWTTANFKDGGVSSRACHKFMYSLYEYVWQYIMEKYLIDAKLRTERQVPGRLINQFFGKVYWDLTTVKNGISNTPGYKEREFDSEYSIQPHYKGDGVVTKMSLSTLKTGIKILFAQNRIVRKHNRNLQKHIDKCMKIFNEYEKDIDKEYSLEELQEKWLKFIKEYYFKGESTYFWQIYINTVEQSIHKKFFLKYVNEMEYLELLGGMNDISHMRSFNEIWNISRLINENSKLCEYWNNNDTYNIAKALKEKDKIMNDIQEYIDEYIRIYGYHSNREIDVTCPSFRENIEDIVIIIKDFMKLEDEFAPDNDKHDRYKLYREQLDKVKSSVSKTTYRRFIRRLKKMRMMLWNREELKDISTRYYYLIRLYTIKLATMYKEMGTLDRVEDIWHLELDDIENIIKGRLKKEDISKIISRNQKYYLSFINYENENEIGLESMLESYTDYTDKYEVYGVGCNSGFVTARARVIKDIEELDTIEKGDILVTKYTDTGWTPKFAKIGGIVTEFGGILCHAAIVSREYGIPCIVCAHKAMKKIKDGDIITVNGKTGQIIIEENAE